jgi:Ran GTPase-activating protein (RanGAP) involved in mRNA processing and transport
MRLSRTSVVCVRDDVFQCTGKITEESAKSITKQMLGISKFPQALIFNNCEILETKSLTEFLNSTLSLLKLDLSNCQINSAIASQLATAFVRNKSIVSLTLANNQICGKGLLPWAEVVQQNKTLTSLDLEANPIKAESELNTFLSALANNTTLAELNLRKIVLDHQAIKQLQLSLKVNQTLREVNLAECFSNQADQRKEIIPALSSMMEKMHLATLNLASNHLNNKEMSVILFLLVRNKSFMHLNLTENKFTNTGLCKKMQVLIDRNLQLNVEWARLVCMIKTTMACMKKNLACSVIPLLNGILQLMGHDVLKKNPPRLNLERFLSSIFLKKVSNLPEEQVKASSGKRKFGCLS